MTLRAHTDPVPALCGGCAAGADLTKLRQTELDLRASEARLNQFITQAPAAIAMFDTDMRYLAASDRFVAYYGLQGETPDSLIGRCHYDFFPKSAARWRSLHCRVLAGESLSSDGEAFARDDGRVDWVRWEMQPWRHTDGTIGGALFLSDDVTKQRAAEAALRDNEERLRLVQQTGGIGYYDRLLDNTTPVVSEEVAEMFGMPAGQSIFGIDELLVNVHPDDRDRAKAVRVLGLARSDSLLTEFRVQRPDGQLRWLGMHTKTLRNADGQPYRLIAALRDITEVVRAREVLTARHDELERSNHDLEQFAYTISHDLKAPLRGVANLAEWIGEDMKETATPEAAENIKLLRARVALMQELLDGLLTYSRAGHTDTTTSEVAVEEVLGDIVAMQAPPPGFVVAYEGEKLTLRTQRVALQVVLENLIGNSIKHHDRAEGRITVATRRVDGVVEFAVSDDGPGIAVRHHQRIFDIFQTLRGAGEREGSGIGLAIVKRKVENHGGAIRVESAPPARGTRFVFTWREEEGS